MASPSADNEEVRDDVVDELLRSSGNDDLEDDIDPRSHNDHGIASVLTNMSQAITATSESLQHSQSQSLSNRVDSAPKRKITDSQRESGQESDSESQLTSTAAGPETKKRSTDEDPLLDEISKTLDETEKTSSKIAPKLANIINKRWLNKLTDDHLKEKQNRYFRPENCESIIMPKVNPKIWSKLDRVTRGRDLQLCPLQSALTKVGHITEETTNTLLTAEPSKLDIDTLVPMNADVIALLGHISFELSQRRRDAIRPHLHREFSTLCASHVPITSFLFGDELQTQINHIRTSKKIGNAAILVQDPPGNSS